MTFMVLIIAFNSRARLYFLYRPSREDGGLTVGTKYQSDDTNNPTITPRTHEQYLTPVRSAVAFCINLDEARLCQYGLSVVAAHEGWVSVIMWHIVTY